MTDNPTVAVLVITYNRWQILRETMVALQEKLIYPDWKMVVADDGSDDGTVQMVKDLGATLVQSNRGGLGANANAGLSVAFDLADVVLQMQDDMQLQQPFDLTPHVERLTEDATSGYIRLWGVGGHRYHAELDGAYWRVLWTSPELYIPSDRPHLKHRRFHDHFGYYPEGLRTDQTEEAWCHQCKDMCQKPGATDVLVPHSLDIEHLFEHLGWHSRWRDVGL